MSIAHSIVSASGASRWMSCLGSVALSKDVPERKSEAAAEGSEAHALAEAILIPAVARRTKRVESGEDPKFRESDLLESLECPTFEKFEPEMLKYVRGYCEYVWREICEYQPKKVLIEQRVVLDEALGMFGTADVAFAFVRDGKRVGRIIDLKYGRGVAVSADSPQLAYYACAIQRQYGPFDLVSCTIYQPRLLQSSSADKSHAYTAQELLEYERLFKESASKALAMAEGRMPLELNPSESTCRFCPARPCEAFRRKLQQDAALDFESVSEPLVPSVVSTGGVAALSDEQVKRVVLNAKALKDFVDAVVEHAIQKAESGAPIAGLKLVTKQGRRVWRKRAEVVEGLRALGVDPFEPKLRSIADVEAELGATAIEGLLTRAKSSRKLVDADDVSDAAEDFEEIE